MLITKMKLLTTTATADRELFLFKNQQLTTGTSTHAQNTRNRLSAYMHRIHSELLALIWLLSTPWSETVTFIIDF